MSNKDWEIVIPLGRAFIALLFDEGIRENIRKVIDGIDGGDITPDMLADSKDDREALEAKLRELLAAE